MQNRSYHRPSSKQIPRVFYYVRRVVIVLFFPLGVYSQVDTTQRNLMPQKDSALVQPDTASLQKDTLPFQKDTMAYEQQDLKDWIAMKRNKPRKPETNANFLLILPYISSNPTAGAIIGGGLTYTFKTNKNDEKFSLISSNASYSTKRVVNVNVKSFAYLLNERLILNGDWRYQVNIETTYGLGTANENSSGIDINGINTATDTLGQAMRYSLLRFYEIASWRLVSRIFGGIGFQYDHYFKIIDETLDKGDSTSFHHSYSAANGFDSEKYTVSGFSVNLMYDSRDNQVNAYKGFFSNIIYRNNLTALGSTENSNTILADVRAFVPLVKKKFPHILAFWTYGNFVVSGKSPYLFLPALGYDQQQRTGRGYRYGRFRGEDLLYGETEYRFPISKRTGILGGVVFLNATTTSDRSNNIMLTENFRLGYGGGLRIMMDKASRTRLTIDAGVSNRTVGFYLAAVEAF